MNNYDNTARRLFESSFESLSDSEKLIVEHIASGTSISRDTNLEFEEETTLGQRLADRVTSFGGSWTFLILFGILMFVWVAINSYLLAQPQAFDPYPYIFLNLILSMMSAIQAPVIMMSQNRQDQKDRIAARVDHEVNLKTELEIRELHRKIDLLLAGGQR
jgi:uncharacterized membrane protein